MPAAVQTQSMSSVSFMLKDQPIEPLVSAFTAVNGRTSPTSPRKVNGTNGMSSEPVHMRAFQPALPEPRQDHKLPAMSRDDWSSSVRSTELPLPNGHRPALPSLDQRDRSPNSPPKRKRSTSSDEESRLQSPPDAPLQARRRLDSHSPPERDASPRNLSPQHSSHMEHLQQRTLPPIERPDHDRAWQAREGQASTSAHYRDTRATDSSPELHHHHHHPPPPPAAPHINGSIESQHAMDSPGATELTRAGVQVDPKKQRKRAFANRTKTGCGTCRRRKKKCDEDKPECNNCSRGGFICEGYANKVPWPKNGITKPPPPLQSKDRYTLEPAQLYHTHGVPRDAYAEPVSQSEGVRTRPIVVEDQERQAHRAPWTNGWTDPRQAPPHQPEHTRPEYAHHTPAPAPLGPPPSEQYAQHPSQGPPPPRHHNPRIYHHTPQTMSQVVNSSPSVTTEAPVHHLHHHAQSAPQQPAIIGPPVPPPPHYTHQAPQRVEKSEKEKMLNGEPFDAYVPQLISERDETRKAIFRFNVTDNESTNITRGERLRHFKAIVLGGVRRQSRGLESGHEHVGQDVQVETPFNCDYGYNLSIGDATVIGSGCNFLDSGKITIGRACRIGANVTIDTQKVPIDPKSTKGFRGLSVASEVTIGENVYIGPNATIAAGVKIGAGAIIYPGSVILKNVPPECVARGNPANISAVNWDD